MPRDEGAFAASPLFNHDPDATDAEIYRRGWIENSRLHRLAKQPEPPQVDAASVCEIHAGWFKTTFPDEAGRFRQREVVNRKGTAWPKATVREGVHNACKDYYHRLGQADPESSDDATFGRISEANELTVQIYDIHPFIDGNTRTTFSLRNYLLDASGLDRLDWGLAGDAESYLRAWKRASPGSHESLDEVVIDLLVMGERRRMSGLG